VREPLGGEGKGQACQELIGCGAVFEGNDDFHVEGQPFLVSFGEAFPGAYEDLAHGLPSVLGWSPQDEISLAAMCNGDVDHRLLAELCLRLVRAFDGIVSFGGQLAIGPSLSGANHVPPVRTENALGVRGLLFATSYLTVNGDYATAHFGDGDLLEAWLQHPRFRMVK